MENPMINDVIRQIEALGVGDPKDLGRKIVGMLQTAQTRVSRDNTTSREYQVVEAARELARKMPAQLSSLGQEVVDYAVIEYAKAHGQ